MAAEKIQYFEKTDSSPQQRDFLIDQNHCSLCSSVLVFDHGFTDDGTEIHETAHCPDCQIKNRSRIYRIM